MAPLTLIQLGSLGYVPFVRTSTAAGKQNVGSLKKGECTNKYVCTCTHTCSLEPEGKIYTCHELIQTKTRNTIFSVTHKARVKGKTPIESRKSEGGEGGVTDE